MKNNPFSSSLFTIQCMREALAPAVVHGRAIVACTPESFHIEAGALKVSGQFGVEGSGTFYLEQSGEGVASLVVALGWPRRKGTLEQSLTQQDLSLILSDHRSQVPPRLGEISGTFCVFSFDGRSHTLWLFCDVWAMAGFYYGGNASMVIASNRAAEVANALGSPFDGISVLSWLRQADIPAGRTLFAGVHRSAHGRGLWMDGINGTAKLVQLLPKRQPISSWSFSETLERTIHTLGKFIPAAASRPSTVIDLTAGNDSRLTVAALSGSSANRTAERVGFRVIGDETDPDVTGAQRIARTLGLNLTRNARIPSDALPVDHFTRAAVLGDTAYPFWVIANRILRETSDWPDIKYHLGSLGGQLFRNWMWQYELLNAGRSPRINYPALLAHRIYNSKEFDAMRLSDGQISINDHDEFLLQPARSIDKLCPDLLNVHKLELIHLQGISQRSIYWPLSGVLQVILPYLWAELTDLCLQMPWRHKRTRALVLRTVRHFRPDLCGIPTDLKAPFISFGLLSAPQYLAYFGWYGWDVLRRHYLPLSIRKAGAATPEIPHEWRAMFRSLDSKGIPFAISNSLRAHIKGESAPLSASQYSEFITIMHLRLLAFNYSNIAMTVDFRSPEAPWHEREIVL